MRTEDQMIESITTALVAARYERDLAVKRSRGFPEQSLTMEINQAERLGGMLALDRTAKALMPSARTLLIMQEGIEQMLRGTYTEQLHDLLNFLDGYQLAGGRLGSVSAQMISPFVEPEMDSQARLLLAGLSNGDARATIRALDILLAVVMWEADAIGEVSKCTIRTTILCSLQQAVELVHVTFIAGASPDVLPDPEPFSDSELDAIWQDFHRGLAEKQAAAVIRALFFLFDAAVDELKTPDYELTIEEEGSGSEQPGLPN